MLDAGFFCRSAAAETKLGKLVVVSKEAGGPIDRSIEQQAPLKDVAKQPE